MTAFERAIAEGFSRWPRELQKAQIKKWINQDREIAAMEHADAWYEVQDRSVKEQQFRRKAWILSTAFCLAFWAAIFWRIF